MHQADAHQVQRAARQRKTGARELQKDASPCKADTKPGRPADGSVTGFADALNVFEAMASLLPTSPPGRLTRKALAFDDEIERLRTSGYTLGAIRQALADAGIHVSLATVSRELTRIARRRQLVARPDMRAAETPSAEVPERCNARPGLPVRTAAAAPSLTSSDLGSGKALADAYMSKLETNPFIRAKE